MIMDASKIYSIVLIVYILTTQGCYVSSSSSLACHPQSSSFIHDLNFQCPLSISFSSPVQMDGESLESALNSIPVDGITAVLFYASWCPFSCEIQSKFGALSYVFPQIKHVMVEESSTLPSVFSRFGIYSLPSILMVNQTGRVQYYGRKDLPSLLHFYKSTTGLDPVVDLTKVQLSYKEITHTVLQPWNQNPLKEVSIKEPYLILSVIFLFLKAFIYLLPQLVCRVNALWLAHAPQLSLRVLGDSNQLLRRVFHVIDLKGIGNKVWGTRNFNKGAQTARVWASSLTSVSLGETSLVRASPI